METVALASLIAPAAALASALRLQASLDSPLTASAVQALASPITVAVAVDSPIDLEEA